jgi:glycosyltransferase involved in cell wall biosynthesis
VLLIDAIRCAADRLPDIRLTIVGDGVLRGELEEQTRRLGLEQNVVFAGRRSDVRDLLPRARVFILTSETEGVALSLMEALACGVPAIAPRVGDLADVLADGVNGFLVDDHTPEAFAGRIVELLTNEPLRLRLAAGARRASVAYTVRAMSRRWEEALRPGPAEAAEAEKAIVRQVQPAKPAVVHERELSGKT